MTGPAILAVGEYRPARIVTNAALPDTLHTSDEWIRERTGIVSRRLAGPAETVEAMAVAAGAKALASAGLDAAAVDVVVLATCSLSRALPAGAPIVAREIGADNAGAYDVNGACAGFCYALALAADAVRAGSARHVLVVGSERMSDLIDWSDRSTAILFGDGAGAVVVGPVNGSGIGPVVWGSDGSRADLIGMTPAAHLTMAGPAVFRWATTAMTPVARAACERAGISPSDLAAVIPHQANRRIVEAIARGIGATGAVVADDIVETGNTSAASIPLALSALLGSGRVTSGDPALLLAFGAGLSWAGQVIRIP